MRNMVSIVAMATLALAACSKPAPSPDAAATASAAASETPAAAALPAPGKYESTSADGKTKSVTTVNANGTYSTSVGGGLPTAGIISLVDGKVCMDPSGKAPAACYTNSTPAADGSFTSTDDKGRVITAHPVAK